MTVRELIAILAKTDLNAPVVINDADTEDWMNIFTIDKEKDINGNAVIVFNYNYVDNYDDRKKQ